MRGDHRAAAVEFYESLRLRPTDYNSVFGLALSLDAIGRHEDAVCCFRRGIELKPDSSEAFNDLGTSHDKAGEIEQAELAYRGALELDPGFSIAAYNLGSLLLRQNRDAESAGYLEKALVGEPQRASTRRQLAWLYATTSLDSLRSPERALTLLGETRAGDSVASPRTLDAIAAAQAAQGDFDVAVATAEHALRLARERNLQDLAAEIEARAALYRAKVPYVRSRA